MNEFFSKSKMNFKKFFLLVPLYILPYHSRYKSFLTRFSIVHTSSCFPNEIRRIIRGEEDRGASITRQWITYSQHPPSTNSKLSFYSAPSRLSRSFLSHERVTIIKQSTSHVLIAQRSTANWASRVYNIYTNDSLLERGDRL